MQYRFPTLRKLGLLLGDIAGTAFALYVAVGLIYIAKPAEITVALYYGMMPLNIILIGVLFNVYGLFTLAKKRYGEIFIGVFLSVLYSLVIMMAISFYVREFSYARSILLLTAFFELVFLNVWQYTMWRVEQIIMEPQHILIIGDASECKRIVHRFGNQPQLRCRAGRVSVDSGEEDEWKDIIYSVDLVLICINLSLKKKAEIVEFCQQMDKQVLLLPTLYELFCSGLEIDKIDDIPFFRPQYLKPSLERRSLKRMMDILLSVPALLFASFIMVPMAIAIKLDSCGPIFYKQIRTGRYEQPFAIYKFRSMCVNAEQNSGPVLASASDERITRVGRFMRCTRIDELPQLINVLKGDMSLVGPRPERPFFVEQFKKEMSEYVYRHNVKPGITGMAQVYGKYNTTVYDKLIYDLMYIQKCDVFTDMVIMIQTIRVLFMKESTEGVAVPAPTAVTAEDGYLSTKLMNAEATTKRSDEGAEKI